MGQFQAEGLVQILHRRVRVLDPARLGGQLER
jgi:hypothetical protein